jgi:queuine/archaeosine tRNA-ribosyltransferase
MERMRHAIDKGEFAEFKKDFLANYKRKGKRE